MMSKNSDESVTDVVCGMSRPKSQMKATSIYKGKMYYFCTEDDKQMFAAYPDRWIAEDKAR